MIVNTSTGKDLFGPGWNARSRVQEYGGGAAIVYGGVVYFSNFGDLKVYAVDAEKGGEPVAVTPGTFGIILSRFLSLLTICGGDSWLRREQKPPIRRFHRIPHYPSPLHRDLRRPHTSVSIRCRNISCPDQHLDENGFAVTLWSGLLRFA